MRKDVTDLYNKFSKQLMDENPENYVSLHKLTLDRITNVIYNTGLADSEHKISFVQTGNKYCAYFQRQYKDNMSLIGSFQIVADALKHFTTKIGEDYQFTVCNCITCMNIRAFFMELTDNGIIIKHNDLELN